MVEVPDEIVDRLYELPPEKFIAARDEAAGRSARDNLPLAEVEATLTAALAEPDVAAAVRAGTLTKSAGYAGFGETPRPRLRIIDGGRREEEPPPAPVTRKGDTDRGDNDRGDADREAAAEKAAEAARTRAKEAQAELHRATEAEQDAARVFAELTGQLEDLRERHAHAQLALRQARMRLKAAQRAAARTSK